MSFRCKRCSNDVYHATLFEGLCPVCIRDHYFAIECIECGEFCGFASVEVAMACATCFEAVEEDYKASQKRHKKENNKCRARTI